MYPTNIYLPVGSNFTAEICAVTPVGRGHCIMYKKTSSPSTTTGMYNLIVFLTCILLLFVYLSNLIQY